jgi:hypothetical protein
VGVGRVKGEDGSEYVQSTLCVCVCVCVCVYESRIMILIKNVLKRGKEDKKE